MDIWGPVHPAALPAPPHFYRLRCSAAPLCTSRCLSGAPWSPRTGLEHFLDPGLQDSWAGRHRVLDCSMTGAWHEGWAGLGASGGVGGEKLLSQAWLCFSQCSPFWKGFRLLSLSCLLLGFLSCNLRLAGSCVCTHIWTQCNPEQVSLFLSV